MAGKAFELEQVLMYRREMEKLRKQELAAARHEYDSAVRELQRQEELLALLTEEYQRCQQGLCCIDDMRMYADFFKRKQEDIRRQKDLVSERDLAVQERRAELAEASKEKKVLESLKDRKAEEFRLDMATKERNFIDEISIQKKAQTS